MPKYKIGNLTVCNDFHIPYSAGSSKDGDTIYIDSRVPRHAKIAGHEVDIYRIVAVHEAVEEALGEEFEYKYQVSHKIAIGAEKVALQLFYPQVPWEKYNQWWQPYLKMCYAAFTNLPPDLDWEPLLDSNDSGAIRRINAIKPGTIDVVKYLKEKK